MPLPMPLEPPITRTCLALKSSSFISRRSFFYLLSTLFDLSGDRCQPCQSSACNTTSRHQLTASDQGGCSMSEFKQLSRSVRGLTVLVTGAASGMGRATARVFAAEGANVAVTDFAAQGAQAVADEIVANGGSAKAWLLDVADRKQIVSVVNGIAGHFGGLDIVVNNAGISVRVAIDDDGYDEAWAKGIAVMLTAHPRIIGAALPFLRKSKSPRIVNIASTEALGATALHSPYSAA